MLWLVWLGLAHAHRAHASVLGVEVAWEAVTITVQVPLDQLGMALGGDARAPAAVLTPQSRPQLAGYLLAHLSLSDTSGVEYAEEVVRLEVDRFAHRAAHESDWLVGEVRLTPPEALDRRELVLAFDGVLHEVVSHRIRVVQPGGALLGVIQAGSPSVVVDGPAPPHRLWLGGIAALGGVVLGWWCWWRR